MDIPACRFCGAGAESQSIKGPYVFGGTDQHKFWHCSRCDMVYLYPVPSVAQESEFYRKEFEKFMADRSGNRAWKRPEEHVASNQDHVVRRRKYLAPYLRPGLNLLEIGCSSGFMMNAFRDAGLSSYGVEPSCVFLDFLKRQGHIAFESLGQLKAAYPGQRYDLIVHFFVLEHIRDPVGFLREQLAMLAPGGRIIFEVPCVTDPLVSLYAVPVFERFYWSIAHHWYFSPTSIGHVAERLGHGVRLIPDQRYDLSNHIQWLREGKPGGQGMYSHVFSDKLIEQYKADLKAKWVCDTLVGIIEA